MFKVEWEPYGRGENFGYTPEFELNPQCLAERGLWLMRCPLICQYAVEHHLPHRVMRQFGLFQTNPPEYKNTDHELHRLDSMICVVLALPLSLICMPLNLGF